MMILIHFYTSVTNNLLDFPLSGNCTPTRPLSNSFSTSYITISLPYHTSVRNIPLNLHGLLLHKFRVFFIPHLLWFSLLLLFLTWFCNSLNWEHPVHHFSFLWYYWVVVIVIYNTSQIVRLLIIVSYHKPRTTNNLY